MSENQSTVEAETESRAQRPLDFSTFLLSLGTSALVQLGEAPDPTTGLSHPADLAGARQTIDLLGLLEDKTRGNLSESEDNLLRNLLRDLRVHYVAKSESG
jgi:hypothetical protein